MVNSDTAKYYFDYARRGKLGRGCLRRLYSNIGLLMNLVSDSMYCVHRVVRQTYSYLCYLCISERVQELELSASAMASAFIDVLPLRPLFDAVSRLA